MYASGLVAYTQQLLDETDGCSDQMNRALTIVQLCWNVACPCALVARFSPLILLLRKTLSSEKTRETQFRTPAVTQPKRPAAQ